MQATRFRSRHARYRFRDLVFENHVAETTSPRTIEAARSNPSFGVGRDFWIEEPVALERAKAGGKSETPPVADPAPARDDLLAMTKSQLGELAASRGLDVDPRAKKDQIVEAILAAN